MPDGQSDGRPRPRVPLRDRARGLWAGGPFREAMVRQADIRPGHRVLDLGCGRGAREVVTPSDAIDPSDHPVPQSTWR
jgi:hypothetical protein